MSKTLRVFSSLFLGLALVMTGLPVHADEPAPTTEAFRAIVKIRTFAHDSEYNLSTIGEGSGIIISSSGLVLTNSHVVDVMSSFDESEEEAAYMICLPENMVDEPDCSYSAKLIAKDSDLDVALLQMKNIADLSSKTVFPFLALNSTDATNTNDPITAIGYPGIGGGTVTVTQGIISGKTEKYGKKWIKTDAIISFGSSGGAALDAANKVIGITSAGHSDLLGSLGYIINIASLNDWITANRTNTPRTTSLDERLIAFAKKLKTLSSSNVFENNIPRFTITKSDGWEFDHWKQNELGIYNPADEDAGDINLTAFQLPYLADAKGIIPFLKLKALERPDVSLFKVLEDKNVQVGNRAGKKITIRDADGDTSFYAVPLRNYIIFVYYSYGSDDKDKSLIESMIQSLNISGSQPAFSELKKYSNKEPFFNFSVDQDWVIQQRDNKAKPLIILNKKYKDMYVTVNIEKTDETTRKLNNEGLLKRVKDMYETANRVGTVLDIRFELAENNPHYKLSKNVTDIIRDVSIVKTSDKKRVVAYDLGYTKKISDAYIVSVNMETMNIDKKTFEIYKKEFDRMMQSFNFGAVTAAPKKDTDKDGLNDDDEKKYGTNPNNKDSDGDGYSDFTELSHGYNPLGKGKLKKK